MKAPENKEIYEYPLNEEQAFRFRAGLINLKPQAITRRYILQPQPGWRNKIKRWFGPKPKPLRMKNPKIKNIIAAPYGEGLKIQIEHEGWEFVDG